MSNFDLVRAYDGRSAEHFRPSGLPHPPVRPAIIPAADRCSAWIDFDGTVTRLDVLDELIRRHAVDESWRAAEADWQAGRIGSRDCLARQLGTVRVTDDQLAALVDDVPLDPGVGRLFDLFARHGVPATIVSDGLDRFIAPLLARAGLGHVAVRSNAVDRHDAGMTLRCPHAADDCRSAAAHCKCHSIVALATAGHDRHLYVGDGRSDLCPACHRADAVFAKGALATALSAEAIAYIPFDTLDDVADRLAAA